MSARSEIRKLPRLLLAIVLVPLYFIPSLILAALRIRFVRISAPGLMGHLAIEPDCYLKDMQLGRVRFARPVLLPRTLVEPANRCLYDYWRRYFTVIENPVLFALASPLWNFPYLRVRAGRYCNTVKETAGCYATCAAWGERPPLLTLTADHVARGESVLRQLGVPQGAWFVCIHSRESGASAWDRNLHDHRNSRIADYRLAMAEIVARGGWCIRVGSAAIEPVEPMPGVIDYPHSGLRSDCMDIFLCARCRFFLGNSSGLFLVSTVFGVPVALANMAPMGGAYALTAKDVSIPKLIVAAEGKRLLDFEEILGSSIGGYRSNEKFVEAGLGIVASTPEEIRDLAIEMIGRLEHSTGERGDDSRLQEGFRRLFRPGHYSYGSVARIGRNFLRRHRDLLAIESTTGTSFASGDDRELIPNR